MLDNFGISPTNALWLLLALMFIWMMYRFQRTNKFYNVADIFMNYTTYPPRADLTSHVIFILMLMFVWACVKRVSENKDVDNLILGGLTIFVLRQGVKIAADAYASKPSAPEPQPTPSRDVNVNVAQPPVNPLAPKGAVPVDIVTPVVPTREVPKDRPPKGKGRK